MATFEQEELWRAAQAMVSSKATEEVLRRMEERMIDQWKMSSPSDCDARDDAYRMVRTVVAFRENLRAMASEPLVMQHNSRLKRT
jgi:hypothetical protein